MGLRVFFHPVCFHLRRLTRSYNMCCSVMYSSCLFCFILFSCSPPPLPTHACQSSEFDLKGGQSPCAEFHILVWVCVPFHEWISLPAFLCITVLRGSHFIFKTMKTSAAVNMENLCGSVICYITYCAGKADEALVLPNGKKYLSEVH